MKNLLKLFVPMAVAVIATVACEQIDNKQRPTEDAALRITVKAHPDQIQGEADTRTYIDNTNTILWGTGEYMKLALTAGETTTFANSTDASADVFNGDSEALFEFSVSPEAAASYTYQGLYPASAAAPTSNTNAANYKVNLPAVQNATASSYDPAAYILVAKPETFNSVQTDWEASFRRATALNKITLKNVPDGKSINKVKITATGKKLAGGRHFDLSTGESSDIYGNEAAIDVKYASALAGANVDVWFTSWGVDLAAGETLEIVAYTTDKKSYTKTITLTGEQRISFKEGYLNTLGANLSGIDPEDVTELEEGDYLVLAKNGTNYYALKAEKDAGGQRLLSVDYNGSLDSYLGDAEFIWSISKSGDSYIFENDGKYLGYKGSSNESYWLAADAEWTGDNYLLDVTVHENPTYYVTLNANASRYLSKNTSSSYFAFYGNTGQYADIVFVPASVDPRTVVTLSFDEDVVGFTTANYDTFLGQDVTASPNVTAVTDHLSWSKVDNDSVIDDFDNGVLTLTGNEGTATVTVSFAGDANYRPAQASYSIEVSAAGSFTLTNSEITPGSNTVEGTNSSKLAYRLGTSSNDGSLTFKAGYSSITFTLAGWASGTRSFSITNGTIDDSASLSPSAGTPSGNINAGFSTTYEGTEYTIIVDDPTEEVVFSGRRCVVWGFTAVQYVAPAVAAPTFSVAQGTYNSAQSVTINCATDGAVIHYTTDGSAPTISSPTYSSAISVNVSMTIKAIAFKESDESAIASSTYTLKVATPTFSPAGGSYGSTQSVSILCATDGASIHYTTDGSTPTAESSSYTSALSVSTTQTIKVIAIKDGWTPSEIASATYTIGGASGSVTFDFSTITETVTGGWNGSHTVSPITITATAANTNKAGQVRLQSGGTITFTGATITRIEIINTGESYTGDLSASVGSYSVVGNNGIWTGSATTVVLTNNGNSGTRTTSIQVTYTN